MSKLKKTILILLAIIFLPITIVIGGIWGIVYFISARKKLEKDYEKRKPRDIIAATFIILLALGTILGLTNQTPNIESIQITAQSEMDVNEHQNISIVITPENAKTDNIEYIVEDSNILDIEHNSDEITLSSSSEEGTTTVYLKSGDIESNKVEIDVVDKARIAREEAEKKAEEERLAQEAAKKAEEERLAQEAAKKAEEERLAQEAAAKAEAERVAQAQVQQQSNQTQQVTNTEMVWITKTGKKYHRISNCGNSKTSRQVPLSQAEASGLTPCDTCY